MYVPGAEENDAGPGGVPVIAAKELYDTAMPDPAGARLAAKLVSTKRIAFLAPPKVLLRKATAILLGLVASEFDRTLAEQLLRMEPAVSSVENLLLVAVPSTVSPDRVYAQGAVDPNEQPSAQSPVPPPPKAIGVFTPGPTDDGWRASPVRNDTKQAAAIPSK